MTNKKEKEELKKEILEEMNVEEIDKARKTILELVDQVNKSFLKSIKGKKVIQRNALTGIIGLMKDYYVNMIDVYEEKYEKEGDPKSTVNGLLKGLKTNVIFQQLLIKSIEKCYGALISDEDEEVIKKLINR